MRLHERPSQADAIAARVDSMGDAFAIIHALRAKFSMAGIEFTTADVADMVYSQYGVYTVDNVDPDDVPVAAITEEVTAGWEYRKLADRLAECGDAVLSDAVADAVARSAA
ncbi:MAG: hypothetical protein L0H59_07270 [Tomitella sp.]|nr:hypothetical protein [Tomitella sp.]